MHAFIASACCLCRAAVAVLWLVALPAGAKLTTFHGYIDTTHALLWVMADAPGPIELAWWPESRQDEHTAALEATAAQGNVVTVRLMGLAPGRSFSYRVIGGGDARAGTLTVQPHWSTPADARELRIAIGSCFVLADVDPLWGGQDYGGGFEIFDAIAAMKPDVLLWMGDYLHFQDSDELDPAAMAARYRRQRTFPPLQRLLGATSHLAIWDDHDYGPNDANMSYVMKGESLQFFWRFWASPSCGLPGTPGVFGYARWGDVDPFLLDDRWYRSANNAPDGPDKTMPGPQQLTWLRNALLHARAPIKPVVNGSPMWNRANRCEGWNHFATAQKTFGEWLAARRIDGVVFLSGDRHFTELLRIERPGACPLYEFASSPLTARAWAVPEAVERENADVVPGTLVCKRPFGMIRVSGPGTDRRLALESYDTAGARQWRQEIRARDLRFPRGPGGE
jgi:alkaline phosphatase D